MDQPKPAKAHKLGDAARLLTVSLDRHRLERVAQVASLKQFNAETCLGQTRIQPLRRRATRYGRILWVRWIN
jgi:hypothetical protein